jgi:hypothetical protein
MAANRWHAVFLRCRWPSMAALCVVVALAPGCGNHSFYCRRSRSTSQKKSTESSRPLLRLFERSSRCILTPTPSGQSCSGIFCNRSKFSRSWFQRLKNSYPRQINRLPRDLLRRNHSNETGCYLNSTLRGSTKRPPATNLYDLYGLDGKIEKEERHRTAIDPMQSIPGFDPHLAGLT